MTLDKYGFIRKVLSRYSYHAQQDKEGTYWDSYSRNLTKKIDYDKLWDVFCKEYSLKSPPAGPELREMSKSCYLDEFKNSTTKWQQVKVYNPITKEISSKDVFPAGVTREQMIRTYEKMSNCTGWQILEVW